MNTSLCESYVIIALAITTNSSKCILFYPSSEQKDIAVGMQLQSATNTASSNYYIHYKFIRPRPYSNRMSLIQIVVVVVVGFLFLTIN